jgi:hypothetical protein
MDKETETEGHLPLHMDKWSRNERLYNHLLSIGAMCTPVFADEGNTKIEAIYVSVEEPLVPTYVGAPVKGPQVGKGVTSTRRNRDNVVDFPTIV